ncbi:hypothetical protein C8J57DRAFT_1544281 [Mycena rebaudengoi]|nr:hypothetical protein C8J57DRAFT_1544281 [Mycena rebaudengoi]
MSFAKSLEAAGIQMSPAVFITIIAAGVVFILVLIITIIYIRRRNRRKMKSGDLDTASFSVITFAHPRPPLPPASYQHPPPPSHQYSHPNPFNPPPPAADVREVKTHQLVVREVQHQEDTYSHLMLALQKPAGAPSLPNQSPRLPYTPTPREMAPPRSPFRAHSPLYPDPPSTPPPPVALPAPPPASLAVPGAVQLKRGLSVRSMESESEYSVASAPYDAQDTYQPFTLNLPAIPASPSTPKWPSSPGAYAWPKRDHTSSSVIRDELAPETYAKVRWRESRMQESQNLNIPTPVARAQSPGHPMALRINVPPPSPLHYATNSEDSVAAFYANAAGSSSSPTHPDHYAQRPPQQYM